MAALLDVLVARVVIVDLDAGAAIGNLRLAFWVIPAEAADAAGLLAAG